MTHRFPSDPRSGAGGAPPERLIRSLVDGPSPVRGFEWREAVGSTNAIAAEVARDGTPEIHVVAADVQTSGRGRLGRRWQAPPGTSLMCSWLLRPPVAMRRGLIPLMAGLALAQSTAPHCPGVPVALKWPNDLLLASGSDSNGRTEQPAPWRKAAGVLVEAPMEGVVIVGTGVNVDWRGVDRPGDLTGSTSLSEAAGARVDRWRLFAGLAGVLTRRYAQLRDDPEGVLAAYRSHCATLGQQVRVDQVHGSSIVGTAVDLDGDGGLIVRTPSGSVTVHAGDVHHVRPASPSGSATPAG